MMARSSSSTITFQFHQGLSLIPWPRHPLHIRFPFNSIKDYPPNIRPGIARKFGVFQFHQGLSKLGI